MPKGKQQSMEGKAMWIKGTIDGYTFYIKAEVNEDDTSVPAATISGWYTQVYEPTFAAEG